MFCLLWGAFVVVCHVEMNAGGFVRDPIEVGVLVEIFADALKI